MSEKKQQRETYITINGISQHSVATLFRCVGIGMQGHYFITNLLLSQFCKNFWNLSTFGKVMGEKLTGSSAHMCAGAMSC